MPGLWRISKRRPSASELRAGIFRNPRPDELIGLGAEADLVPTGVVAEPGTWERQLDHARDVRHVALEVGRQGLDLGLGL